MQISVAAVTDSGRRRARNEDRYLATPPIIAVADGMGGRAMGDLSAEIMIEELTTKEWDNLSCVEASVRVQLAVDRACTRIMNLFGYSSQEAAPDPQLLHSNADKKFCNGVDKENAGGDTRERMLQNGDSTMESTKNGAAEKSASKRNLLAKDHALASGGGTTLAGALRAKDGRWLVFHIGDSRVYLWREGKLIRITKDHSLVQQMIDSGEITEDEAREHPRRSVITRAVGTYGKPICDIGVVESQKEDVLLACSDGLSDEVDDDVLAKVIGDATGETPGSMEGLAFALRDVALAHGGRDNVTIAVMSLGE